MTMKQIEQSMAMFRKSCVEKTGVEAGLIDGLHKGNWPEDDKKLKVPTQPFKLVKLNCFVLSPRCFTFELFMFFCSVLRFA